jgi:hypothetical protein
MIYSITTSLVCIVWEHSHIGLNLQAGHHLCSDHESFLDRPLRTLAHWLEFAGWASTLLRS